MARTHTALVIRVEAGNRRVLAGEILLPKRTTLLPSLSTAAPRSRPIRGANASACADLQGWKQNRDISEPRTQIARMVDVARSAPIRRLISAISPSHLCRPIGHGARASH